MFVGSLVGAIVENMKNHIEPTCKKLHIYSAVSTVLHYQFLHILYNASLRFMSNGEDSFSKKHNILSHEITSLIFITLCVI